MNDTKNSSKKLSLPRKKMKLSSQIKMKIEKIKNGIFKLIKTFINYWVLAMCITLSTAIIIISIFILDPSNSNSVLFYTTISGTFAGAFLAFTLTQLVEHRKEKENRISSINRALFTLLRQYNVIIQYRNHCHEHREKPEPKRSLEMPCLQPPMYTNLVFNFNELSFLLEKYAGTALELSVAEDSFHQALASIKERNLHHVNKVQATIKEKNLRSRHVPIDSLKDEFEEDVYEIMLHQTKDVYEQIDRNMKSIPEIQDKLIEAAESFYPDKKFQMFLIAEDK